MRFFLFFEKIHCFVLFYCIFVCFFSVIFTFTRRKLLGQMLHHHDEKKLLFWLVKVMCI